MTWIVTGGAGYIGAHVVHRLHRQHEVVVFDDLSAGRLDRLPPAVPLVKGSVTSRDDLDRLFRRYPADGVIHLAAVKSVDESVRDPQLYQRVNVDGVRELTGAMRRAAVSRLMFASSAAVYGDTGRRPAHEWRRPRPVNPYGSTKRAGERILAAAGGRHLDALVFRMFNVVGAGDHPYALDPSPTGLLPAVFHAATEGTELIVRGRDHPTPDGSPVRDYLHVADVADAYARGVDLLSGRRRWRRHRVINLGRGTGTSVVDLVRLAGRVTGVELRHRAGPPRPGDAASVVAAVGRARQAGLASRRTLDQAVADAWASWQRYVA